MKNRLKNRESNVCRKTQVCLHQKKLQPLSVLLGVTLLIVSTVSPARAQMEEPPWAEDDFEWTTYEVPVLIYVLGNDSSFSGSIDPTTVSIVDQPFDGSVSIDATTGEVTYDPDLGFAGSDYFTYTVADEEGLVSNVAIVEIEVWNDPPEIQGFESYPGYLDAWTFEGTVVDENPEGVTVTFGGLLDGHSTTADEDGTFSYTVILTGAGLVTAQATDELGEESDVAETFVEDF